MGGRTVFKVIHALIPMKKMRWGNLFQGYIRYSRIIITYCKWYPAYKVRYRALCSRLLCRYVSVKIRHAYCKFSRIHYVEILNLVNVSAGWRKCKFNYLKASNQNCCLFFEYLKKIVQNSEVECWSDQFSPRPPLRAFTVLAKKKNMSKEGEARMKLV